MTLNPDKPCISEKSGCAPNCLNRFSHPDDKYYKQKAANSMNRKAVRDTRSGKRKDGQKRRRFCSEQMI